MFSSSLEQSGWIEGRVLLGGDQDVSRLWLEKDVELRAILGVKQVAQLTSTEAPFNREFKFLISSNKP